MLDSVCLKYSLKATYRLFYKNVNQNIFAYHREHKKSVCVHFSRQSISNKHCVRNRMK